MTRSEKMGPFLRLMSIGYMSSLLCSTISHLVQRLGGVRKWEKTEGTIQYMQFPFHVRMRTRPRRPPLSNARS